MKSGVIFFLLSCGCAFAGVVNGSAESGDMGGWNTLKAETIIYSTQRQSQSTGTVLPGEGDYFFSFCKSPASYAKMSQTGLIGPGVSSLTLSGLFRVSILVMELQH